MKNIALIDKADIHNNSLQVIHQYEVGPDQGVKHATRYDVTSWSTGCRWSTSS